MSKNRVEAKRKMLFAISDACTMIAAASSELAEYEEKKRSSKKAKVEAFQCWSLKELQTFETSLKKLGPDARSIHEKYLTQKDLKDIEHHVKIYITAERVEAPPKRSKEGKNKNEKNEKKDKKESHPTLKKVSAAKQAFQQGGKNTKKQNSDDEESNNGHDSEEDSDHHSSD